MKLLTKTFHENVFDNTYHVVIGDEGLAEKWLQKKLPEYHPIIDNAYACALHYTGKKRATVIFFSKEAWNDKEYCHDNIAHEALHATVRSLSQHKVLFDEENHEVYCYTLGWIVRNIYALKNKK